MRREYCDGKNCYDKRGAEEVKNLRWREDHVRLRIYNCPTCGHWHVTSKVDEVEPKRRSVMGE